MRLLLQVKGVISITFDMNKKRCILRTKTEVRPEVGILILLFLDSENYVNLLGHCAVISMLL